jgi:MFS family permease
MIMRFRDLHPTTQRLLLARAFRSVGQGALVVDLALYLHALGWTGFAIGLVLSGAGLFGATLSLGVGIASDRLHRRPFLLIYEGIVLVCSIAAFLTSQRLILTCAIIGAGFGRGANGAAGPFSPVEQAWLAEEVLPERRGRVYSLNTALGFFGMGFGALLAILPSVFAGFFGPTSTTNTLHPLSYRPLFIIVGLATIVNLFLLWNANEQFSTSRRSATRSSKDPDTTARKRENRVLTGLVLLNSFNGMAIGFTGPLISYWFALRFGVGPAAIAPVMSATFIITGAASLVTGRMSERIGIVRSVVWARLVGLAMLIALPLMPFYWLASLVYMLRSAFNRGSVGARQALTVGLVRDERRGLATSLNAVSMQLPQSVGPSIAGYLFSAGNLVLPFYIGAILQAAYVFAYGRFFRDYNLPRSARVVEDEPDVG